MTDATVTIVSCIILTFHCSLCPHCTLSDIHCDCLWAGAIINYIHILQVQSTLKELVKLAVKIHTSTVAINSKKKCLLLFLQKTLKLSPNICKIFHSQIALAIALENFQGQSLC